MTKQQSRGDAYEAWLDSPAFSDSDAKTRDFVDPFNILQERSTLIWMLYDNQGNRYALVDLVRNAFIAGANYEMKRAMAETDRPVCPANTKGIKP